MWGDANCSNTVDVSDAVLIARFAAEDKAAKITGAGMRNADVSGDGNITSEDCVKILKYIAKLITEEELAPAKAQQQAPKNSLALNLYIGRDELKKNSL